MSRRSDGIADGVIVLLLAWFVLGLLRLLARPVKARVRSTSGPTDLQAQLGDESAVAQWEAAERAQWAAALGIDPATVDFTIIEDHAKLAGGPVSWAQSNWPSPCGPEDDPRRYCDLAQLTAQLAAGDELPDPVMVT